MESYKNCRYSMDQSQSLYDGGQNDEVESNDESLIPKIISKFEPDEETIFFDPDSEKPERLIFEIDGPYRDFEEEGLAELEEYILQHEKCDEINEFYDRANKLRFLQANHYNLDKTLDNMIEHIEFMNSKTPFTLSDEARDILERGLRYTTGRDRYFRPLVIIRTAVLTESKINYDEAINAGFYGSFHMIKNLLVPGKCENWIAILDMQNLAITKLPVKFTIKFVTMIQAHEKCRTRCFFVFNVNFAIRAFYRILTPFLDAKIKEKITMCKESSHPNLLKLVHPSQLEKKFGGEIEDLSCYWPPQCFSNEFGHDPNLIYFILFLN